MQFVPISTTHTVGCDGNVTGLGTHSLVCSQGKKWTELLLRIGQDSHYRENSLGRFVLLCYHSWLYVISLTLLICRAEFLVVWKRAVLSPTISGGSHTVLALEALQGDNAVTE